MTPEEAWQEITRLANLAFRICRSLGLSEEDSELIRNAVLMALLRYFQRHEALPERPIGFIRTIIQRRSASCFDQYRRRGNTSSFDELDEWIPLEEVVSPLEMLSQVEDNTRLHDAIARLPDNYRVVILLRFFVGLTYQEVAEILVCPLGTVQTRQRRALQLLLRFLTD